MSRRYLTAATYGVAILGLLALTLSDEIGRGYLVAAWTAFVIGWVLDRSPETQQKLRHAETPVVLGLIAIILIDFLVLHTTVFLTIAHFLILFQIFKYIGLKDRKDCLQILLFGFFQILAACTLSIELSQGIMLLLFVPIASIGFFWQQVEWQRERSGVAFSSHDEKPYRWITFFIGVGALPVNLFLTISVFLFFPRLTFNMTLPGLGNNNFGYSQQIDLSKTGELHSSQTPVLWLQFESDSERDGWNGYLRGDTLETFDGRRWSPAEASRRSLAPDYRGQFHLAASRPSAVLMHAVVTLVNPAGSTLFVPGSPIAVTAPLNAIYLSEDGSLHAAAPITKPISYGVVSGTDIPLPGADDLLPTQDLSLPELMFSHTKQFADDVAGVGFPEERARRIETYLKSHYRYSLQLADTPAASDPNPLEDFLFVRRRGPCSYFASAMAVMLRFEGIPSRIVAGYIHGEWNDPAGQYLIRDADAHAWVEAYIPGLGWRTFDPSPRDVGPSHAHHYSVGARALQYWDYLQLQWNHLIINYDLYSQLRALQKLQNAGQPMIDRWSHRNDFWLKHRARPTATPSSSSRFSWKIITSAAALALGFIMIRLYRRKLMSSHSNSAVRTYQQFLNHMAQAGMPKESSETAEEYAERLKKLQPTLRDVTDRATETYNTARFSGRSLLILLTLTLLGMPMGAVHADSIDTGDIKSMIAALKSNDADQREHAVESLKTMGPAAAPAIPALRNALNDDLPYVRTRAAEALAGIGAPAVPAFIDALSNDSSDVRSIAATALGRLGSAASSAVPALVNVLKDSDSTARSNASNALIRIGGDAPNAAIRLFKDENSSTRLTAVRTVGMMSTNDPAVFTALKGRFVDENIQVRLAAVKGLGSHGAAVVPSMIEGLQSSESTVREQSCTVLADLGHKSKAAVPQLIKLLKDSDASVRGAAAVALGKIGSASQPAVPALQDLTKDSNSNVASKAQEALTNISALFEQQNSGPSPALVNITSEPDQPRATFAKAGKKKAPAAHAPLVHAAHKPSKAEPAPHKIPSDVAALIKRLADFDDDVVRLEASQQLVAMGSKAVYGLITAVDHSTITVRVEATAVLGQIGAPAASAIPILMQNLRAPATELREPSAISLLQIDSTTAFAALTSLAKEDRDTGIRLNAIHVLGQIGAAGAPAVPGLIEVMKDSDTQISSKATMALSQIGTTEATTAVKLHDRQMLNRQVQDLLKTLRKNGPSIDSKAVDQLVTLGLAGIPSLSAALHDSNPAVKGGAARVLNRFGKDAAPATNALIDALDDGDPTVRKESAEALGKIDSPQAQSALRFFPEKDWARSLLKH